MYRGKLWPRREIDKGNSKRNISCTKGNYEAIMIVEVTPNEKLAKICRKALQEAELKIRIVERVGRSLKRILKKSDPFRKIP